MDPLLLTCSCENVTAVLPYIIRCAICKELEEILPPLGLPVSSGMVLKGGIGPFRSNVNLLKNSQKRPVRVSS